MATTIDRYKLIVDTKEATNSINGITGNLKGLASAFAAAFTVKELVTVAARFENLRTSLGLVFKDVATGAQAFEQIKAFAASSVFSVEQLTETVIKLKAAGLDPTVEQLRLFADVSSVAADSIGALTAITDLYARTTAGGLGLEDLNRLQDRGIPVFKILAENAGLARDEISKVGQSAKGAQAILAVLQDGLSQQFSGASAAKAQTLSQAISNLQDALQNAFDTIGQSGFNTALRDVINSLTDFITKNKEVIKSLGEGLGVAITTAAENLKYLAAILAGVFAAAAAGRILAIAAAVIEFKKAIQGATIAATLLQGVTGVGLVKVGVGLAAAAVAIGTIETLSGDASDNIKSLQSEIDNLNTGPILPGGPQANTALNAAKDTINQLKTGQEQITASAAQYFKSYSDGVTDFKTNIAQQTELLKLTDDQAAIQSEMYRFEQNYLNTINSLQDKIAQAKAKNTEASLAEAAALQSQLTSVSELYKNSTTEIREQLQIQQRITKEVEAEKLLRENMFSAIQGQADFYNVLEDRTADLQLSLAKLNLNDLQQQTLEVDVQVSRLLADYENSIRERVRLKEIDAALGKQLLDDARKFTTEQIAKEQALTVQLSKTQRSFAYGWKKAFEEYEDNATNAAKKAEQVFAKTTKGMEDMIVNFAKTGKFEFKSFVASLLEDLLRAQIQKSMALALQLPAFGGAGGTVGSQAGGLFGGFFATGGMIPPGRFGVVGENGPEIVSGPANVTPGLGGNVTYNIQAVDARSFKELVAADPGFIHAVATKGGSSVPRRR